MDEILRAELATWNLKDEEKRWEKIEREKVRYPKMLEEMGINLLDLHNKVVVDVGCGPISALVYLEAREKVGIDPLIEEYKKIYPQDPTITWIQAEAERIPLPDEYANLVLCMNALDHFKKPQVAVKEMLRILRPGGYLGVHCCINNATFNPNPAHQINLSYSQFRSWVDSEFETIVSRIVRYGWRKWRGKVGQPAFAWLGRLTIKYEEN